MQIRSLKKQFNWRKTCFRLHGWLGLNLGLLLFVICFSGSIATLSNEIDWLLNPAMRVEAGERPYAWGAMYEALDEAFPEGRVTSVNAPIGPRFAAMAYVDMPYGQTRKVYLNPYTGAVQGHTSFFNTQRFFRSFHRRFFDGERGIVIVTLCGFVLLAAALMGFLFHKGWLKQLFRLRRDRGPRLLWSDLHKGAGIWGLAFALLIGFTGVFYFVEVCFQAAGRYDKLLPPPLPEVEVASLAVYGPQPELLPVETYVAAAQAAFPGLHIKSVGLPHRADQPVYLDGQAGNPLTRDRANKVLVHPFSGDVIAVQRSSELSMVPFITDAVDPLHFGYFSGLGTKMLWCVLGLALSFAILSGTYLWIVRTQPIRRSPSPRASSDESSERLRLMPFSWLRGASVAFALTLAYFLVVVFSTVSGIRDYGPTAAPTRTVGEAAAGPYRVRLDCSVPCHIEKGAVFTARFRGEGLPNYRRATLGPGTAADAVLQGPARAPTGTVTVPPRASLRLRVTGWDGETFAAVFPAQAIRTARVTAPAASAAADGALPDTAPGVWWVVGTFVALTIGIMIGWLLCLIRAFRAIQQKTLQRHRASAPAPQPSVRKTISLGVE